ncbi:hypothetical protein M378DRAFT_11771 [Amanita muscaria Koide BX008]|uniref:Uncharacterized protein n=1 Tax=Amanita muscaria (strain Koide BX008) TaxID=946122 RepID=A0A0C2SLL0_AMAMK|nr:hypothetical protein M378DRAFT_11771 [Amanita muscaria Koide BX008]
MFLSTSVFCSRTLQQPFSMPGFQTTRIDSFIELSEQPGAHRHNGVTAVLWRRRHTAAGGLPTEWEQSHVPIIRAFMAHTGGFETVTGRFWILLSRQRMRTLSGKTRGVLISITKDRWERIGCAEVLAIDGYHGNLVLTGNSEASGDLEVEFQQRSAVGHRVQRSTAAGISSKNARIMPGDLILAAEGSRNTGRSLKPGPQSQQQELAGGGIDRVGAVLSHRHFGLVQSATVATTTTTSLQ